MKLFSNPASPFGRKVKVAAIETGLIGRIEVVDVRTTAVAPDDALLAVNPLAKIPCLVTAEAGALYDSRVICEYLDGLHEGPRLFPAEGPARWAALRLQALADGIMDAALLARYEAFLRPEERRWPDWSAAQLAKAGRALDSLENGTADLDGEPDIGRVALACALGYLDFRFPDLAWRQGRGRLAGWFAGIAARDSMRRTAPSS